MATVQLKIGPLDHGRAVTMDDFDAAEFVAGYRYEIIEGRVYVSPEPSFPEHYLEIWLRRKLERFGDTHPDLIELVATKGRVFLQTAYRPTVPEPDIAVYAPLPEFESINEIKWEEISPVLVAEVLVGGDIAKDLSRNPDLYHRVPSIKEYWVLNGSQSVDEPVLVVHRRRGKSWTITTFSYGSTFTTKLLPGFELLINPRK